MNSPSFEDVVQQLLAMHRELQEEVRNLQAGLNDGNAEGSNTRPRREDADQPAQSAFLLLGSENEPDASPVSLRPSGFEPACRPTSLVGEWVDKAGEFLNGAVLVVDNNNWGPARNYGDDDDDDGDSEPDRRVYTIEKHCDTCWDLIVTSLDGTREGFQMQPGPGRTAIISSLQTGRQYELLARRTESRIMASRTAHDMARTPGPSQRRRSAWGALVKRARATVRHPLFDPICATLILVNGVLLGYQVSYAAQLQGNPHPAWGVLQMLLTFFFIVEVLLRMLSVGRRRYFSGDDFGWNAFDSIIVVSSVAELIFSLGGVSASVGGKIAVLRVLRVLKIVRVARVFHMFRFFKELRMMVYSILFCLRPLLWVMALLIAVVFIFAVSFVQIATEYREAAGPSEERESAALARWFGSLLQGMYTLFCVVTGGPGWNEVASALGEIDRFYVWAMCFYVCFMLFAVLNIVTGVFVEGAISCAQSQREAIIQNEIDQQKNRCNELRRLFGELDADSSGFIDIKEMETALKNEQIKACFRTLGLQVNDAWEMFRLCDQDGSHTVRRDEFVFGCMKLSGNAKHLDMSIIMEQMHKSLSFIHRSISNQEALRNRVTESRRSRQSSLQSSGHERQVCL